MKLLRCYLHDPASSDVVHVTVEILWNVLEHCHDVTDVAGPPCGLADQITIKEALHERHVPAVG